MTSIDSELLEALLQGEEGTTLDHKSEQYNFIGAADAEKAELLKDILAMANAWKTSDAHIVVGAKESPGGRAIVQGVAAHIDDAKLQQFVNGKTNEPVTFSYEAVTVEGKMLGVFTIAREQHKPIWLKKDFGGLAAHAVYLRRGSSTAIADPDEIARMGEMRVRQPATGQLQVGIGDPEDSTDPGTTFEVTSTVWIEPPPPPPPPPLPRALRQHMSLMERMVVRPVSFDPTPKEVFEWRRERDLYRPVSVHVRNVGQVVVSDVRVELTVRRNGGLLLCGDDGLPEKPTGSMPMVTARFRGLPSDTWVTAYTDHWIVVLKMGKIQPGGQAWSDPFYVGAASAMIVDVEARTLADEIASPPRTALSLLIVAKEERYQEVSADDGDDD